jgi:hypothetical protein
MVMVSRQCDRAEFSVQYDGISMILVGCWVLGYPKGDSCNFDPYLFPEKIYRILLAKMRRFR